MAMSRHARRMNQRAGVLLDLVLAVGLILLAAFVLFAFGITFHEILSGAGHFFGI